MFPDRLSTERLELAPLSPDSVGLREIHGYRSTASDTIEAELRYLPATPHETLKETRDWLADEADGFADGERATYAVRRRSDDRFVGTAGLRPRWERRAGYVVVWLRKPHWGEGFAVECVRSMVELGFDLGLGVVALSHETGNERSRRLIEGFVENAGGQYDGRLRNWVAHDDHVADLHRYAIAADEYEGADA